MVSISHIHLNKIYKHLGRVHVEIDINFLKSLLVSASRSDSPHKDKIFISQLGKKINETTRTSPTIYGWLTGKRTIPLEKLVKISRISNHPWKQIEENIISLKSGKSCKGQIYPKFPLKIDFKMGSLIGHILGDGSIDSKYQQVFYSNSNKKLLNEFLGNMKKVFGIKPRIWMQTPSTFEGKTKWDRRLNNIEELKEGRCCGLFYPSICGKIFNRIFNNFAVGTKKEITKVILNSNKDFKRGLMRAFYDDEGSIMKEGRSVRLYQDRKNILESFKSLLLEFKITSRKIKTYKKRDKKRYYLDIHRKSNFVQFEKEIGFTSSKKKERLKKLAIIKNHKNSK